MRAATVEQTQQFTSPGSAVSSAPIVRRPRHRSALLWCVGGFVAGAVFWYAVGFWRYVSDVMLNSGPQLAPEMTAAAKPVDASLPTIYLVDPHNCTALVLDRRTSSTEVRPCPQEGLALRLEPDSERESLAAVGALSGYPAN
jgi:hypothetical protein